MWSGRVPSSDPSPIADLTQAVILAAFPQLFKHSQTALQQESNPSHGAVACHMHLLGLKALNIISPAIRLGKKSAQLPAV